MMARNWGCTLELARGITSLKLPPWFRLPESSSHDLSLGHDRACKCKAWSECASEASRFAQNSVASATREDAINADMVCMSKRFKLVCVERSMSKSLRQLSCRASRSSLTLTSGWKQGMCGEGGVVWLDAVAICRQAHTVKLTFDFCPQPTDKRSSFSALTQTEASVSSAAAATPCTPRVSCAPGVTSYHGMRHLRARDALRPCWQLFRLGRFARSRSALSDSARA